MAKLTNYQLDALTDDIEEYLNSKIGDTPKITKFFALQEELGNKVRDKIKNSITEAEREFFSVSITTTPISEYRLKYPTSQPNVPQELVEPLKEAREEFKQISNKQVNRAMIKRKLILADLKTSSTLDIGQLKLEFEREFLK